MLEVVGDKSQKLEWSGYGFCLEVPDGALPKGKTASVGVKAILSGQFKLPESSHLISAIYWVSSSEKFLEDVTVQIQHCAVIKSEECNKFGFVIGKCNQKELPYLLKERAGVFTPDTPYAFIKLKTFSFFGVFSWFGVQYSYTLHIFHRQKDPLNIEFDAVITQNVVLQLKVSIIRPESFYLQNKITNKYYSPWNIPIEC